MAITKQAKNYSVFVEKEYNITVKGKLESASDEIRVDARDGELNLISNKKVVNNGGTES